MAVAGHGHARGQGDGERQPLFLGRGIVEFGHVRGEAREVDVGEVLAARPGFGLGDGQERVEGHEQVVDLADGRFEHGPVFLRGAAFGQGEFEPGPDAVQGAAQVVGDVVGHLLDPVHELGDLVEHGVQVAGQPVELVAGPAAGDAAGEVAGHDFPAGLVDHVDALEHPAAGQQPAHAAEHHREPQAPDERVHDQPLHLEAKRHVASDQQVEVAGQQEVAHAHAPGLEIFRILKRRVEPARARVAEFGPFGQVAGQGIEFPVREQVDARAGLVLGHAGLDDANQPREPELAVLLGQALDLGVDGLVGLALHEAGGGGVDEPQKHQHRQAEGGHVQDGKAQGRGAQELSWNHAGCIPRPGSWRAGVCRGPCRSSGAAG
ncbi:hypothetical protein DSECCO2_601880 [anaerobic digester metagenome]